MASYVRDEALALCSRDWAEGATVGVMAVVRWWRRLPQRKRVGLAAVLVVGVALIAAPGIWSALAFLAVMFGNIFAYARADRRYLREARARDLTEAPDQ